MAFIQLSKYIGIRAERIAGYEIFQKDDNLWIVKWDTDDGTKESEKFPSKNKAIEYAKEIGDLVEESDRVKEDYE